MTLDLERCRTHIEAGARPRYRGRVRRVTGLIVEAHGVPAAVGEVCRINRGKAGSIDAEVVGFRGTATLLMPHGPLEDVAPDQEVVALEHAFQVGVGPQLLGRLLDGFGRPIDGGPKLPVLELRRARADAPEAMSRKPITEPLQTGVRAIDGLNTLGRGQRVGIFSGSGVGKSTLLSQVARGTDADVIVCALVGERGREVGEFIDRVLASRSQQSVTIAATSDRPPIERYLAPFTAVTVAEYFRDRGLNVLFVMDSITRFAGASREIGLAAGEPPTVRGYPPSFFATVPRLVERLGSTDAGSITGLITVLLDADDPNDPVADTLRGLLDGHLFLSRKLAQRGHFPAVDVLASLSRLMDDVTSPEQVAVAREIRGAIAAFEDGRDLVEIGAYKPGTNPRLDDAIGLMPGIETFLRQGVGDMSSFDQTLQSLAAALQPGGVSR